MGNQLGGSHKSQREQTPAEKKEQAKNSEEKKENRKKKQQQVGLAWMATRNIGATTAARPLRNITPKTECRLRHLKLQRQHDWLCMEEELLKRNKVRPQVPNVAELLELDEVEKLRGLMKICTLSEMIDDEHCVVEDSSQEWYMRICSFVDKNMLTLKSSVLCKASEHGEDRSPKCVVGVMPETEANQTGFLIEHAPKETYGDVAGLENVLQELKETVELPLTQPQLYDNMGIKPPTGVILYGPPGTGKTLMAKAVANSTSATFLRASGSELVKSVLGEGPKQMRLLFTLAKKHAPSILFIDEVDAIGSKRYDSSSSGEKEVQRTLLELLNQLDGFDQCKDVKVILATNRIDTLDAALIRPGRIDRKLELPLPSPQARMTILKMLATSMHMSPDVDLEKLNAGMEGMSGADIKCVCSEGGMRALRDRRLSVNRDDLESALEQLSLNKESATMATLYN